MVITEETVFKTQRPHHFNICWSDRGEPCCLVKVLDVLKFSSTPPCGPPQGSSFKIFQISRCPGLSDGYHIGHFFIWLTNEKSPTWVWNYRCGATFPRRSVKRSLTTIMRRRRSSKRTCEMRICRAKRAKWCRQKARRCSSTTLTHLPVKALSHVWPWEKK